jgi:hypothetical protein
MRHLKTFALALGVALPSFRAAAVESGVVKLSERWSVVGVVGGEGESHRAVAVLRQNSTQKTFTLALGDSLPFEGGFVVAAVRGRGVVVTRGDESVTLAFAESPADDGSEAPSRTARFIDNYYRGLGDSPIELTDRGFSTSGEDPRTDSTFLRRFPPIPPLPEDGRGEYRYDLYRSDRPYGGDRDGDQGGFTVTYDNFDDETAEGNGPSTLAQPATLPPLPPLAERLKTPLYVPVDGGVGANESEQALEESAPAE